MKIVTMPKIDSNVLMIPLPTVGTGHKTYTGAGRHQDRRTKRNRTRAKRHDGAVREWA